MATNMFQITEEDLAALESNLSLIYREGVDQVRLVERSDLREAWEMTIKTLSRIRFDYGPPIRIHQISSDL